MNPVEHLIEMHKSLNFEGFWKDVQINFLGKHS